MLGESYKRQPELWNLQRILRRKTMTTPPLEGERGAKVYNKKTKLSDSPKTWKPVPH